MQNICGKCGGGFGEYTAPEARCKCVTSLVPPDQKKKFRHELALAEANYLRSQGWDPIDVLNGTEGYVWKAPDVYGGHSPISQSVAVEVQKKIDRATVNSVRDTWLAGISTTKLIEAVNDNSKVTKMRIAEMNLQRALHI